LDGDGLSQAFEITGTSSMDEVVAKINQSAGGVVQASLSDSGKLVLTAEGAESITLEEGTGTPGDTGLAAVGVDPAGDSAGFSLVLNKMPGNDTEIKVTTDNAVLLADAGFDTRGADGSIQGTAIAAGVALNKGDLVINGVEIGAV